MERRFQFNLLPSSGLVSTGYIVVSIGYIVVSIGYIVVNIGYIVVSIGYILGQYWIHCGQWSSVILCDVNYPWQ